MNNKSILKQMKKTITTIDDFKQEGQVFALDHQIAKCTDCLIDLYQMIKTDEQKNAEDYKLAVELISQAIRLNSNSGDSSEDTIEKFLNGGHSDAAMQACFLIKQTSDMLCEKFDWLNVELG